LGGGSYNNNQPFYSQSSWDRIIEIKSHEQKNRYKTRAKKKKKIKGDKKQNKKEEKKIIKR
jgi:hypothetical protein